MITTGTVLAVSPVSAQEPPPPPATVSPTEVLTLEKLLQQVGENYPKLIGADAERRAAAAKRLSTQGAFDPQVYASYANQLYNSSSEPGKAKTLNTNIVGIEVTTRYGTKLFAEREQTFGAAKSPSSSTGTGGTYSFGVKQPLLRDAGINPKSAKEQQAKLGEPLADQFFAIIRLDIYFDAASAYWKWVAAGRKVVIAEEILRLAIERANFVREEILAMARPGIDQVEADQEVRLRQQQLVQARRALEEAAFKLQKFLWVEEQGETAPGAERIPPTALTQSPVEIQPEAIQTARQTALETRPELKAIAIAQEVIAVDSQLARNDLKPNLDVVLQPGQDVGSRSIGDTLKAGLLFTVPLYQREAKGRLSEAELKLEKLRQEETLTRQTIQIEVDDAISLVNRTYQRYIEAEETLRLALRLEEGERERFRAGDSTLFLLNQRERGRFEAAVRVIDIRAEYEQALANLQRVTATF